MAADAKEQQGINMPSDRTTSEEQKWKSFVQGHCDSLFQTALLLSADTTLAAAALADSIGDFDISNPPEKSSLAIWERAVMTRSIGAGEPASPGHGLMVRSMLQPGLWPVIQIERFPRICFVSLVLLGYPASFCAQTLVVAESEVPTLLQKAFTQLCSITAAAWRKA